LICNVKASPRWLEETKNGCRRDVTLSTCPGRRTASSGIARRNSDACPNNFVHYIFKLIEPSKQFSVHVQELGDRERNRSLVIHVCKPFYESARIVKVITLILQVIRIAVKITIIAVRAVSGAVAGGVDYVANILGSFKICDKRISKLQHDLNQQSQEYEDKITDLRSGHALADSTVLGGTLLFDLLLMKNVPADIQQAYEAAFPIESQMESFSEKVNSLSDEQLTGFISNIKGKLFEIKYTDYLNSGELPDGYFAQMAESVNQPGWDIQIIGEDSEIVNQIQLKATNSVGYVQEAIERYPEIDVVSTDEVYSQLTLIGAAEHVQAAGITENELAVALDSACDDVGLSFDFDVPILSFALIAFTSYRLKDLNVYQKAHYAGARAGKSYLSYLIGGGVAAVTNTWWLGIVACLSTHVLCAKGKRKRAIISQLKDLKQTNYQYIKRVNKLLKQQKKSRFRRQIGAMCWTH